MNGGGGIYMSPNYLVRSTFIGQVLNGQRYPFRPTPFAAIAAPLPAMPGLATEKAG